MPSGPGFDASGKVGAGNVLLGAVPGLLISRVTNSRFDGFSHERSPIFGSLPVDLPCTVTPKTPEMSCGDSIAHASIRFALCGAAEPPLDGAL